MTIDRRRGSVLMEFIVVFPIYLLFFGGVFSVGEMLLRPIWLQSAGRTAAFDVQNADANGWKWVTDRVFPVDSVGVAGGLQDQASKSESAYYADARVSGPFSLRAAAKTCDQYQMAPWTHGWMGFPTWSSAHRQDVGGQLGQLFAKQRVKIFAKEETDSRQYDFYVVKRVKYTGAQKNWRHNGRPVSDLVNAAFAGAHWYADVYKEGWHDAVTDTSNTKRDPAGTGTFQDYSRYGIYVTWSE